LKNNIIMREQPCLRSAENQALGSPLLRNAFTARGAAESFAPMFNGYLNPKWVRMLFPVDLNWYIAMEMNARPIRSKNFPSSAEQLAASQKHCEQLFASFPRT